MSEFKVAINSESDFNIVMALAESMGYYNGLEFKYIPKVKVLFLPHDCKHIEWSHRGLEHYQGEKFGKEVSIEELQKIAAGHRIDKVVPVYANPKFTYTILTGAQVGSVLQLTPQIDEMGDDTHIESHISPLCKSKDV